MPYVREDIRGTSGQDINKINENFMNIFEKVFGDINYSDVDNVLKNRINTQWIPVQGEGNLDSKYPLYIRFFVPPNTSKVKSTDFNIMCENYRMDSSITSTQPSNVYTDTQTSSEYPGALQTSSSSIQGVSSISSANVGVSSVSSVNVGVTSVSGGGSTSGAGGEYSAFVDKWGVFNGDRYTAPTEPYKKGDMVTGIGGGYFYTPGKDDMVLGSHPLTIGSTSTWLIDIYSLQHNHYLPVHYHSTPNHYHSITLQPHSHTVTLNPHTHDITMNSHSHDVNIPPHKHNVSVSIKIPEHSHNLKEGVMVSTTQPSNVIMYINDQSVATIDSSKPTANNIDITDKVKIGEWNVIKVTTSNLARVSVYGTLEVIIKSI